MGRSSNYTDLKLLAAISGSASRRAALEQLGVASKLASFNALASDLDFGTPAEHVAGRKPYEYHRDTLLTLMESAA